MCKQAFILGRKEPQQINSVLRPLNTSKGPARALFLLTGLFTWIAGTKELWQSITTKPGHPGRDAEPGGAAEGLQNTRGGVVCSN